MLELYVPEYDPKKNVIVVAEPEMLSPEEFCRRLGVKADNTPIAGEPTSLGQLMANNFLHSKEYMVVSEEESISQGNRHFLLDYSRISLIIFIGADGNQHIWNDKTHPNITVFLTEIGATQAQQNNFFKFYSQSFADPFRTFYTTVHSKISNNIALDQGQYDAGMEEIFPYFITSGGPQQFATNSNLVIDFSQDPEKVICHSRGIKQRGNSSPYCVTGTSFEVDAEGQQYTQFGASEFPKRYLQMEIEQKIMTAAERDAILAREKQHQEAAAQEYQRLYAQYDAIPNKPEPTPLPKPRVVFPSDLRLGLLVELRFLNQSLTQDQVARAYPKNQKLQQFRLSTADLIAALKFHPSSLMLQQRVSEIEAANTKEGKRNSTAEISNLNVRGEKIRTLLSQVADTRNKSLLRRLFRGNSLTESEAIASGNLQDVFFGDILLKDLQDPQRFDAKNRNFWYALNSYPLEVLQKAFSHNSEALANLEQSRTFIRETEWFRTLKTATRQEIAEYWQKEPIKKLLSLDKALTIELMHANVDLRIFFTENAAARKQVGLVKEDLTGFVEDIPYLIRRGRFVAAFGDDKIQRVDLNVAIQESRVILSLKNCDNLSLITLFKALKAGKAGYFLQTKTAEFESFLNHATKLILDGTLPQEADRPAVNNLAAAISGNSEVALAVFDYLQKQYAEAPEANKTAYLTRLVDLARADHSGKVAEKLLETSAWIRWRGKHPSTKLSAEQISKIVAAHEHNDAVLESTLKLTDKRKISLADYALLYTTINSQNTLEKLKIQNVLLIGQFNENILAKPKIGNFDLLVRKFEAGDKSLDDIKEFIENSEWNTNDTRGFFTNAYLVNFVVVHNLLPTKVLADLLTAPRFESLRPLIQLNYLLSDKQKAELIDELASRDEIPDMIPGTPYHYVQRQAQIVKDLGGARPRPQPVQPEQPVQLEPEVQLVPAAVQPPEPAKVKVFELRDYLNSINTSDEFIQACNFDEIHQYFQEENITADTLAARVENFCTFRPSIFQNLELENRDEAIKSFAKLKLFVLEFSTPGTIEQNAKLMLMSWENIVTSIKLSEMFEEEPADDDLASSKSKVVKLEREQEELESRNLEAATSDMLLQKLNNAIDSLDTDSFQRYWNNNNIRSKIFAAIDGLSGQQAKDKAIEKIIQFIREKFPKAQRKNLLGLITPEQWKLIFNTTKPGFFKSICNSSTIRACFTECSADVLSEFNEVFKVFRPAAVVNNNKELFAYVDFRFATIRDPNLLFIFVGQTILLSHEPVENFNKLRPEQVQKLFKTTTKYDSFKTLCGYPTVKSYFDDNSAAIAAFADAKFQFDILDSERGVLFREFLEGLHISTFSSRVDPRLAAESKERVKAEAEAEAEAKAKAIADAEAARLAEKRQQAGSNSSDYSSTQSRGPAQGMESDADELIKQIEEVSKDWSAENGEMIVEILNTAKTRDKIFETKTADQLCRLVRCIENHEAQEGADKINKFGYQELSAIFDNTTDAVEFIGLCTNKFINDSVVADEGSLEALITFSPRILSGEIDDRVKQAWGTFVMQLVLVQSDVAVLQGAVTTVVDTLENIITKQQMMVCLAALSEKYQADEAMAPKIEAAQRIIKA